MKKLFGVLLFLTFVSQFTRLDAQENGVNFGRFIFNLSTKPMKDGPITEVGIGYKYTERAYGELRYRSTKISMNEKLEDVADSLNATEEDIMEFFLLPYQFSFVNTDTTKIQAGPGIFYQYDKLHEKGFFDMPVLETMGKERVNSFENDFSMHILGLLIDGSLSNKSRYVDISLSAGIVPYFMLISSQNQKLFPLLPENAKYDQTTFGSPYCYARLEITLFKYLNAALLLDYMKLDYKSIDFDDSLNWINPQKATDALSFKTEVSLLLPIAENVSGQIGIGYCIDYLTIDKNEPVKSDKVYVIFTTGKK